VRVVLRAPWKFDHVACIFYVYFQWLHVRLLRQRIKFKPAVTVFKCMNGSASAHHWPRTECLYCLLLIDDADAASPKNYSPLETSQSPAHFSRIVYRLLSASRYWQLHHLLGTWRLFFLPGPTHLGTIYFALYKYELARCGRSCHCFILISGKGEL